MAEPKGTDSKPTETKSGAVKPPVLDLKAREAGTGDKKPEPPKEDATRSQPPPKPAPKPATATAAPAGGLAVGAALAGGVLGLAAAYGLAFFGLWPDQPVTPPPADPRLAQFATAIPELETVTRTTQSELAALNQRLGALEAAGTTDAPAAAAQSPDLAGVQADIAALGQRIDAIAAAPAESADPAALEALRADLTGLASRLDELGARLGTAEAELRTLDTTVSEATATLADQPGDIGAILQLPLILSSLESAFASGRPYETEMASLRAALPNAQVPPSVANAAPTGLTRPDAIARRFETVLPAMLAGRPADPDAPWQEGALDWFGSMIALRPTGEVEGDTPEAVMSRLEAAVARRDVLAPAARMGELPDPKRTAASDVPALNTRPAAAASFLETLRASALAGGPAT